jgi:hypothetical protein
VCVCVCVCVSVVCEKSDILTRRLQQVDDWSPELIEIEANAKEGARLLFFVIDNMTRAIAASIEVAFLSSRGRALMLVSNLMSSGASVADEVLSERFVA